MMIAVTVARHGGGEAEAEAPSPDDADRRAHPVTPRSAISRAAAASSSHATAVA